MKEIQIQGLTEKVLKNKWFQRTVGVIGVAGATELGLRSGVIPQQDIFSSLRTGTDRTAAAAGVNRTFVPIALRHESFNPDLRITSTPTPTVRPEVNPTPTPPATSEGTPTLSPAEHYSRLNLIDRETSNGVSVNIWKTNSAIVTGDFNDTHRQELARLISANSQSLGSNAFTSADLVFVKNRWDSPMGIVMYPLEVNSADPNFVPVFVGFTGYTRIDGKLILYYALETGLEQNNAIFKENLNRSPGRDILQFSKDGTSPNNNMPFTKEEWGIITQYPIRVF